MSSPSVPTASSQTSFPFLVDFHAKQHPEAPYAVLAPPNTSDIPAKSDLIKISWGQLHRAVHRAAHLINPVPTNGIPVGGKVVAVIAVTDNLIYQTIVLAIARSGNTPFPVSHRNSPAAIINVLTKTDCHDVIVAGGPAITSLLAEARLELKKAQYELRILDLPSLAQLYPMFVGQYTGEETFEEYPIPSDVGDLDSKRLYIHSSGTTSLPKPIGLDERFIRNLGNSTVVQQMGSIKLLAAFALPAFHLMGHIAQVTMPLYTGSTTAMFSPAMSGSEHLPPPVPTPEITIQAIRSTHATGTLSVPSFVVSWSHDEEAVNTLNSLDYIMTGGGPLPDEVGDYLVTRGVRVVSLYGGTEFSVVTSLENTRATPAEWSWLEFAPEVPVHLVPHDDGQQILYELLVKETEIFRPAVLNGSIPEGRVYATSDLFLKHPSKNLYKIVGRMDDQVTLVNGEKVNPGPIEGTICENFLIKGAVVFGRGQTQIGALIEPAEGFEVDPESEESLIEFRNAIWPSIETANRNSPAFARLFKETIIPTTPSKLLPRTPKGTISRKVAIKQYEEEIEKMYSEIEKAKGGDDALLPDGWTAGELNIWLKSILAEILEHDIVVHQDIFDQGADSLTATVLRNRIVGAMGKSADAAVTSKSSLIDSGVIFAHSTIDSLATHLANLVSPSASMPSTPEDTVEQHVRDMNILIERYSGDLPEISIHRSEKSSALEREVVLVTGTTGALGSLMLARLLENPKVEKIWAINRASRGKTLLERQLESFVDKAIDIGLIQKAEREGKVYFVEAELSADRLGLSEELYSEIRLSTTLIIHNAWRLDFNLAVTSFEPYIRGSRNLVDLALTGPHPESVRYLFTSSVGTLLGWKDPSVVVPEEPISDPRISVGNGYGESKYVTEKILEKVADKTGLRTVNIRVGQLSGTRNNGFWSTTDWVPIIAASSLRLGVLPDAVGDASWVPLDFAADSVLEIGLERNLPSQQTVHLYHPRPTPWATIVSGLSQALSSLPSFSSNSPIPTISIKEWVQMLEEKAKSATEEDVRRIPALKLLSFYRPLAQGDEFLRLRASSSTPRINEALGFVTLATEKAQALSPTVRKMPSIGQEGSHPERWVQYWSSRGLFD